MACKEPRVVKVKLVFFVLAGPLYILRSGHGQPGTKNVRVSDRPRSTTRTSCMRRFRDPASAADSHSTNIVKHAISSNALWSRRLDICNHMPCDFSLQCPAFAPRHTPISPISPYCPTLHNNTAISWRCDPAHAILAIGCRSYYRRPRAPPRLFLRADYGREHLKM